MHESICLNQGITGRTGQAKRGSDGLCYDRHRYVRSVGVRPDSRRVLHRAGGVEVTAKSHDARTVLEVGEHEQVHAQVDRGATPCTKRVGRKGVDRVHAGGAERSECSK
eukprot:3948855-Pleurochrysis_carterae.AAC.1